MSVLLKANKNVGLNTRDYLLMRIHLLSDLHLEFASFAPQALDVDVVIRAGDVDIKARGVAWAKSSFAVPVLYVPGNHEYYKGGHLVRTLEKMQGMQDERVRVLDRDQVVIGNVRFLGATMWTDYTATGNRPIAASIARSNMSDFSQIRTGDFRRIRPEDLIGQCEQTREWLNARLHEPFAGKTVVITHHAPALRSLQDNHYISDHLGAAYANEWLDFMGDRVALWVHGHSHTAVDYEISGTRVVCNPRGYPGEETGFNEGLVITI